MSNPAFPKGHVTFLHTIYHQVLSESPTSIDPRGNYPIYSDEQPYVRTLRLTAEWSRIDTGWITEASLLVIENLREIKFSEKVNEFALVNPGPKEKKLQAESIVQLGFSLVDPVPPQVTPQAPRDMHSSPRPMTPIPMVKTEPTIHPCIVVKPGRACTFEPSGLDLIYIRGTMPGVKVKISVFPR